MRLTMEYLMILGEAVVCMAVIIAAAYYLSRKGLATKILLMTSPTIATSFLLGIMFAGLGFTPVTGIVFFVVSMVIGLGFIWAVYKWIVTPINTMAEIGAQLAEGDLEHQVKFKSKDEIGHMGDSIQRVIVYLNEMAEVAGNIAQGNLLVRIEPRSEKDALGRACSRMVTNLNQLIGQVQTSTFGVSNTSSQMAMVAQQAEQVTTRFTTTIRQMAQRAEQQSAALGGVAVSVEQMSRVIDGVAQGGQEQAVAVSRSAGITTQLTTAIRQVAANARAGSQGSTQVAEAARIGAGTIAETIEEMQSIKAKVGLVAQKVQEMGQRSDQIGAIIETINDIASQTHLLALNAAIEAARSDMHIQILTGKLMDHHMVVEARLLAELLSADACDESPTFWSELANRINIDDIFVTDQDGVVIFCNHAGLVGFRFSDDPNNQSYPFRRLLNQTNGVVCQKAQPRAADGQVFKYVGVSRRDQPGIVQVGFHLDSLSQYESQISGGFAVVAGEVRRLAEKSAAATAEIAELIKGIQNTVTDAVAAMDEGAAEIENGVARSNEAGQALGDILQSVEVVTRQVGEIEAAVEQMNASANEFVTVMDTVSAVVEENSAATAEMAAGSDEVAQAIEGVAGMSKENCAAANEASEAAEAMNVQVEEVGASAQSLGEMVQVLQGLVMQFRLDTTQASEPMDAPLLPASVSCPIKSGQRD